ncbi:MAG: DNA polymerase III subunit gamma/tau [Ferruginibacter sp.]
MEKFIVSARKYRPQNFGTVVGQQHITTTLKNAINNNQLAHAFLFCGPRGVGKTTCARILAKTINCQNRTKDGEACNKCNSCISFDNGTSLNIHELDAASNNSVDDIRTLVEQVRFAPQAGDYKVYIVDEVHMLSAAAFNAFLKTLEEPPPYAIFILATTEKHKILPTILSRCQIFDFKRITSNDTVEHLQDICKKEGIKAEKAALHVIAQKSEGAMRDSLSILDKIVSFTGGEITYSNTLEHLNILDEDYYFRMLEFMQKQELSEALLLFDNINQKGFEGDTFLEGLAEFIRNLMVSKDTKAAVLLDVAEDFKEKYIKTARQVSAGWMIAALNILSDANIGYKQSRNKKLFVEMTLIKLCYLQQAIEIAAGQEGLTKKKLMDDAKPVSFRSLSPVKINEPTQKPAAKTENTITTTPAASLVIEKPVPVAAAKKPAEILQTVSAEPGKPVSTLKGIREKILAQNKNGNNAAKQLSTGELKNAWDQYIEILTQKKNHSAVTNFRLATLSITDENSFSITVSTNIQQKFIEAERSLLVEHLQNHFSNRLLKYQVTVEESEQESLPKEKGLTRKQQFQLLIEKYPNIKALKDRLKMELE